MISGRRSNMKNKVQIVEKQIMVNGKRVGWLEGSRSEVWVILLKNTDPSLDYMTMMAWENRFSVARFKYFQPTAKAKRFVKWALERFTTKEVIEGMEAARLQDLEWMKTLDKGGSLSNRPLSWAEANGYQWVRAANRKEKQ